MTTLRSLAPGAQFTLTRTGELYRVIQKGTVHSEVLRLFPAPDRRDPPRLHNACRVTPPPPPPPPQ